MKEQRRGTVSTPWKQLHGGERCELGDPWATPINAATIAHALAHTVRFAGHLNEPESVAFHSILVSRIAGDMAEAHGESLGFVVHTRRLGLLHDAHEAFVGDVGTPIKHVMHQTEVGKKWDDFEHKWQHRVLSYYGLGAPPANMGGWVKQADLIALQTERLAWFSHELTWEGLENVGARPDALKAVMRAVDRPEWTGRASWLHSTPTRDLVFGHVPRLAFLATGRMLGLWL